MAAGTSVFSDKEINNWLKACLALNITKEGLANFLDRELQTFHSTVGISCGSCSIEKLIPCPTYPYCSKRKRNYCPYHKSQIPHPCLKCDHVKQNITLHHRYKNPSWRNTDAIKWQSDCWEIGKCFLPPDGYSSVSSVQESDFNGVISIMLNCMHFQTNCLSSSCLSPPPPDKQSPLEMVRQIGRDVRHSSDCKVKDADLQGYFQRLSTLLADPKRLLHDHLATIAHKRLSDLQNNRMSLKELGELLKEAYQTLDRAKEAGERVSKEAEKNLAEALHTLETAMRAGEQRLEIKTQLGELRIESKTLAVEKRIETKGHDVEQGLDRKIKDVQDSIVYMQQAANKSASEEYERGVAAHLIEIVENLTDKTLDELRKYLEQCMEDLNVLMGEHFSKTVESPHEQSCKGPQIEALCSYFDGSKQFHVLLMMKHTATDKHWAIFTKACDDRYKCFEGGLETSSDSFVVYVPAKTLKIKVMLMFLTMSQS